MNLVNNNISPLPFYDDISSQNHRKDYAFGNIYPLISPKNVILPFQVVLSGGTSVSWVRLYEFKTGSYTDITTSMKEAGLKINSYTDFKVLVYPGTFPIVEIKYEGLYYLGINITGYGTIYSDVFCVKWMVDDLLYLEYKNSYSFELSGGIVDFSDNFKFKCYLDTQVGRPEYEFEEEATERLGYSYIESQVSKKIYKFTFLAPEYICDALRIVRLCDTKQIKSKGHTYDLTTFSMDVDWEDQGDLASVECEFETDTVIANLGGVRAEPLGGDFNEDFDYDFYDREAGEINITVSLPGSSGGVVVIGEIDVTADKAVKSNLVISVGYTQSNGGTGTTNISLLRGNTSGMVMVGTQVQSLTSATLTTVGSSDKTTYNITIE